ncbi:hypothetical protein H9L19_06645 [Weissella diestrammenae]|uniref:Uncharacterized protein n=1 Tax=Weissella diestrammenae TaxID=1162633 RepID=A0A7G9T4M8_9LACO|nr:putative holin-like toxin [Weissella diestrammenae]MCM0582152.1 hypothetical protein [Weissella diestrammenae]QNN75053.1 hypothetical protein H9L19_06645 [Weissella diestrammenae]
MTVFGALLLLIAIGMLIVIGVKLIIDKAKKIEEVSAKNKRTMKITFILVIAGILFMIIGVSNSSKTSNKSDTESTKSVSDKKMVSKFNKLLVDHLTEDKGFATGKLDENGKELPDGQTKEPNINFAWSLYVNKIEYNYAGTEAIKVYLSKDAIDTLTKSEILEVAKKAQSAAASQIFMDNKMVKFFDLNTKDNSNLTFTVVTDASGKEIGRSSALDNSLTLDSFK